MTRKYLVTGGAGFIGSNYAQKLIQRSEAVTIFDNLSRAGALRNMAWLKEQFGENAFRLIVGDVRNADQMAEKLDEYEHSNLSKILFEKKRTETIINLMSDPVIGLDEQNKIMFANEQALELLNIKAES